MNDATNQDDADLDVSFDIEITKTTRRAAGCGTWVCGRLCGHRFDALVFPEHAEVATYELDDSRISKLWVQRLADQVTVANFDRGWDVEPTTDVAKQIIGFLAAGLADHTYGTNA